DEDRRLILENALNGIYPKISNPRGPEVPLPSIKLTEELLQTIQNFNYHMEFVLKKDRRINIPKCSMEGCEIPDCDFIEHKYYVPKFSLAHTFPQKSFQCRNELITDVVPKEITK